MESMNRSVQVGNREYITSAPSASEASFEMNLVSFKMNLVSYGMNLVSYGMKIVFCGMETVSS